MRPIKFRAWHRELERMFSAEEMAEDQMALLPTGYFANIHSRHTDLSQIDYTRIMIPLQYTGLKDKNGTEIYEGDILGGKNYTHEVRWVDDGFEVLSPKGNTSLRSFLFQYDVELIGNVHENPEWLGEHPGDYEHPSHVGESQ